MTAMLLATALLVLLGAGATIGPRVLGGPTPTFSARPRLGMAIWTISAAVWTLAFLALGPLLTWIFTGPGLPGRVGAVCQRCVAAANPFSAQSPMWTTDVPVLAMLLIPLSLAAWLTISATVRHVRSREHLRAHLQALTAVAEQQRLNGTQVWLVPTPDRTASPHAGCASSSPRAHSMRSVVMSSPRSSPTNGHTSSSGTTRSWGHCTASGQSLAGCR
jgi:hypothetical protein